MHMMQCKINLSREISSPSILKIEPTGEEPVCMSNFVYQFGTPGPLCLAQLEYFLVFSSQMAERNSSAGNALKNMKGKISVAHTL